MFPILQVWHVAIQTPGLILIVSLWIAWDLADRYFRKLQVEASRANKLIAITLVMTLLGGRLVYVAANAAAFAASPISLMSLNPSLWDLPGGIVIGLVSGGAYGLRQKIDFWRLLDSLTPSFALFMIALGLAHLASGSAFGAPAWLPWSLYLWGEWRHPSQIYETLAATGVLAWVLLRFRHLASANPPRSASGGLFLEFVAWSAVWRTFLEAFRGDSVLLFGQFREAQVVAWVILAGTLFLMGKKSARQASNASVDPTSAR
jgi:phosphatidylglycerol---prolipoprotein diacylglyceryl transferase